MKGSAWLKHSKIVTIGSPPPRVRAPPSHTSVSQFTISPLQVDLFSLTSTGISGWGLRKLQNKSLDPPSPEVHLYSAHGPSATPWGTWYVAGYTPRNGQKPERWKHTLRAKNRQSCTVRDNETPYPVTE